MTDNYIQLNMELLRNPRVSIIPSPSNIHTLEININDTEGQDRKRPRITILYDDGTEQNIDIVSSVRNNAASIGHPLILYAIRRWEEIVRIRYHRSIRRDDGLCEIAKNHLQEVGSALLAGSKERAVSKETAFYYDITRSRCLNLAWDFLGQDDFKNIRNDDEKKLTQLEAHLMSALVPLHPPIDTIGKKRSGRLRDPRIDILVDICRVIDFLKSEDGRTFLRKRRSLAIIGNAFDAWRSGLDLSTVRRYKSVAMRKYLDQKEWFNPYFLVTNAISLTDLSHTDPLQLPLIVIPSEQVDFTVD